MRGLRCSDLMESHTMSFIVFSEKFKSINQSLTTTETSLHENMITSVTCDSDMAMKWWQQHDESTTHYRVFSHLSRSVGC